MSAALFHAPAKVNLGLRVVDRRADGFHLLESGMAFFPLFDRLTVTTGGEEIRLVCLPPVTGRPEENLVVRAACALRQEAGVSHGAEIHLEKSIPAAAGLGGGSSDAALALLALNRMWGLDLPCETLARLGLSLGADLPFFLGGASAQVRGVGEILEPWRHPPGWELLLVNPGVPLATAQVFRLYAERLTNPASPGKIPAFPEKEPLFLEGIPLDNDLEPVAETLLPVIGIMREALLREGARAAFLSGSGPTMVGVFPDASRAARAKTGLQAACPGWKIFQGALFHQHPFAGEWLHWAVAKR